MDAIEIRGARTHNLKVDQLTIPRDQLIVITGLSGSGKSSLAFDTLYAEGQRRYVNSLSAYARQFLSVMDKPDVDHIDGLSPAISIEQKTTSHNPRSTVGTVTEIYDYCRLLFARAGEPRCPTHQATLEAQTIQEMVTQLLSHPEGTPFYLFAPVVRDRKGEHKQLLASLKKQGYLRVAIDNELYELDDLPAIDPKKRHRISVLIDRVKIRPDIKTRLADSMDTALQLSDGLVLATSPGNDIDYLFCSRYACAECGYSVPELEPRLFSFNNPAGACPDCEGLGMREVFSPSLIVQQPHLSLSAGAIYGWNRRHPYYLELLTCVAAHYGFSLDTPYQALSEDIQSILLYGSGEESLHFRVTDMKGQLREKNQPFEGIIPTFTRRYKNTDSDAMRDELARFIVSEPCKRCHGARLREEARSVYLGNETLPALMTRSIDHLHAFFETVALSGRRQAIAEKIIKEIQTRLTFLLDIGLNYLNLNRSADTLSGGEAQRIRLASQIGAGLVGVMYVLDEPSIGLHARDNARLIDTLIQLRDMGNTVIVVEHDQEAILSADHVIDMGPGAGNLGGEVIAQGTPRQILKHKSSLTGHYLSGKKEIARSVDQKAPGDHWLRILGATGHNLKGVTAEFPVGLFTCVTGVSGSGKSTLINQTLHPHAAHQLNRASLGAAAPCDGIKGLEHFDKVIAIDQSPIGRTPRSNPATYTGLFTPIRTLFSETVEAKSRGYSPGRFSFNVRGGRCESCQGDGLIRVEMHFLSDVYVLCDVCQGRRYNAETLEIHYKGKTIDQVLDMTVQEALPFFDAVPSIRNKLKTLMDVGLSYVKLGQSATTLSGGEAQRMKLSRELSKRDTGRTLYILDEPTTGLHFEDIQQLIGVFQRLLDKGNTIIVIEHNLDVVRNADWVVDLGPEGGRDGGEIVATGRPQDIIRSERSHTGACLKEYFEA